MTVRNVQKKISAMLAPLLMVACAAAGNGDPLDGEGGAPSSAGSGGGGAPTVGGSSGSTASVAGGGTAGSTAGGKSGASNEGGASSGGKAGASSAGSGGASGSSGASSGGAGGSGGSMLQTGITARFKTEETNTSGATSAVLGEMRVVNTDGGNATLSLLKLRYYFTNEGNMPEFEKRWGQLQATNASVNMEFTGTVVKLSTPKPTADSYLEFAFSGSSVLDAGKTAVASFRLYDGSNQPVFNQGNDYSFSAQPVDSNKIVLLYRDVVIWGSEP